MLRMQSNGLESMHALRGAHSCFPRFCHISLHFATKSRVFVGFKAGNVVFLRLHGGGLKTGVRAKRLADVLLSC